MSPEWLTRDPPVWRELRAYCRGLRAGHHEAAHRTLVAETLRLEALIDHAVRELRLSLPWIRRERCASWDSRYRSAQRLRRALLTSLRRYL